MNPLQSWLNGLSRCHFVPLFATDADRTVRTHLRGARRDRRTLTRSPEFDAAMIEMVETGLSDDHWHGFLYLMGVGERQTFTPLYVGKAEKRGQTHAVSANLINIRSNHGFFGRWGYNLDYHIGDLSHALFGFQARRPPTRKYRRWADSLFETADPPRLREAVFVCLVPWFRDSRGPSGLIGSVPAAEKEVIALASVLAGARLLNTDGR
ncbi:hypothetical protein HNR42_003172 [Deinobacterium chartae]|uniref:Uncharacterized protein n=1 Tax=Deinobacterium chartae TaxID=521158 RepID=A0A841I3U6_9DEIO|nr:hypothetical protein [Deinobacterium chartae]MBB6099714.1 hypothetical protein [Deinobacterium chartae]